MRVGFRPARVETWGIGAGCGSAEAGRVGEFASTWTAWDAYRHAMPKGDGSGHGQG